MAPVRELLYEEEEEDERDPIEGLIGESSAWRKVLQQIELVASSNVTVLITGESGTGKEVVAKAIHAKGARSQRPFVIVNCAAIAPELFESEFFGHTRGAFTGAHKDRDGRFGLADGGTIFLDEVGEIPPALQGKLLRVLQEGQYERVGEDRTRSVDVRVIAATNRDLGKEVEAGRFRQDLFYRLSVFPIHIAPLRERLEDVPLLAEHFMRKLNLSHCFLYKLTVQQIFDAMLLSEQRKQLDAIAKEPLIADGHSQNKIMTYAEMKNLERENLITALQVTNYRIYGAGGAAELLGVKPTTLASRIKALQIPLRPRK